MTKINIPRLVFKIFMHGLKYYLQFEWEHATLVSTSDLNLQFKVKYLPQVWERSKYNSYCLTFDVVVATDGKSPTVSNSYI